VLGVSGCFVGMVQSAGCGTCDWTKEASSEAVREAVALDGSMGRRCG